MRRNNGKGVASSDNGHRWSTTEDNANPTRKDTLHLTPSFTTALPERHSLFRNLPGMNETSGVSGPGKRRHLFIRSKIIPRRREYDRLSLNPAFNILLFKFNLVCQKIGIYGILLQWPDKAKCQRQLFPAISNKCNVIKEKNEYPNHQKVFQHSFSKILKYFVDRCIMSCEIFDPLEIYITENRNLSICRSNALHNVL